MCPECLLTISPHPTVSIKWGISCSQTRALPQGWDRLTRWEVIPGNWNVVWKEGIYSRHVGLSCAFCELEDRGTSSGQRGENTSAWLAPWEKGGRWKQGFPQQRAPLQHPGIFGRLVLTVTGSVFACYFSTSRPSVNQRQCARRADLPLPPARLCFPLTHPPGEAPPRSLLELRHHCP